MVRPCTGAAGGHANLHSSSVPPLVVVLTVQVFLSHMYKGAGGGGGGAGGGDGTCAGVGTGVISFGVWVHLIVPTDELSEPMKSTDQLL